MPIFEKYGIDGKTIVRMLKLNELDGLYDINDRARERQQEVFEEIIDGEGDIYVKPEELQEHEGRLAYCYEFLESAAFRDLTPRVKVLIRHHVRDREKLQAEGLGSEDLVDANAGNNPPGPSAAAGPTPEAPTAVPTEPPPAI